MVSGVVTWRSDLLTKLIKDVSYACVIHEFCSTRSLQE
jgi:hypothetical protein